MMIADDPLKPLPLPAVAVVVTVGATVVVEGADTLGWGKPGASGLVPWATAAAGSTSATPRTTARKARKARNTPPNDYASGCSIAGVSGASTYGCSSAASSSW
jgi:hypothetical protein